MRTLLFIALVSIVGAAAGASAEGCQGATDAVSIVEHIFDNADLNGDDLLTRAEYEGAGLQSYGVTFAESDTNSDGATSMEEYLALYEQHHPAADEVEA